MSEIIELHTEKPGALPVETFTYGLEQVRVVTGEDGEPRFVLTDLCRVLGLSNPTMVANRLDDDEKGLSLTDTPGGRQRITTVTEAGMYAVILRSDKPEAQAFKRWITHEVLPAIRKHGGYLTPVAVEAALTDPDFIIGLATSLKEERAARAALAAEHAELEAQVAADAPHTHLGRAVAAADGDVLVKAVADALTQEGITCNQVTLFAWLRAHGWLCKAQGNMWNAPTKWALERGYLRSAQRVIKTNTRGDLIKHTPYVTGLGAEVLVDGFTTGRFHLEEATA